MANAFARKADLTPYRSGPARVPLDDKKPQRSATAERSKRLDVSALELADDDELNDILWLAFKGTPPPAPVRSRFGR